MLAVCLWWLVTVPEADLWAPVGTGV
jgi:hypothetical protein